MTLYTFLFIYTPMCTPKIPFYAAQVYPHIQLDNSSMLFACPYSRPYRPL